MTTSIIEENSPGKEVSPVIQKGSINISSEIEEFAVNCSSGNSGGGYGTYRLRGGITAVFCSFAFFPGVMINALGWIPFVVVGPLLVWLRSAARDQNPKRKKNARAFCCSFMTISAIMVCFSALRFYSLFFTPIVVAQGDIQMLEMLELWDGNSLLEELHISNMFQVDGLHCAEHLKKERLKAAFENCGHTAETCGCRFWNHTSNSADVLQLYGHLPFRDRRQITVPFMLFPAAVLLHVIPSIFALLIGPFQLNPNFRAVSFKRHKIAGWIYACSVVIGAAGSIWLEAVSTIAFFGTLGFMCLSFAWIFTLCMAVSAINHFPWDKEKRILSHRRWMTRNYALTFSAVTRRWYLVAFWQIFGNDLGYWIQGWLAWIPNVILVELYLKRNHLGDKGGSLVEH